MCDLDAIFQAPKSNSSRQVASYSTPWEGHSSHPGLVRAGVLDIGLFSDDAPL
jgi:hypothetical protein